MTGRIITIGSSKGGGGKTCLCCCLAPNLAVHGYRVGVIDADPNAAFYAWHAGYSGPPIRCQAEARDVPVVDLAQAWANELDAILIDTAGFGNLTAAAAMGAADYVLVPCMPDRGSTREAAKTIAKAASLARAARRAIPASVILSQWRIREWPRQRRWRIWSTTASRRSCRPSCRNARHFAECLSTAKDWFRAPSDTQSTL